jgi:osmotically-inducible protein OsmY
MDKRRLWVKRGILVSLGLFCGCSDQEAEQISHVSNKAMGRVEELAVHVKDRLEIATPVLSSSPEVTDVNSRVASRLRYDQALADSTIQVQGSGGVVTLRGQVSEDGQRQRALELASTTLGVVQVYDALEVVLARQPEPLQP